MNVQDKTHIGTSIAIVGMVGKFPGSVTLQEFWANLSQGKETISFFDEEQLMEAGVDAAHLANPNFVRARGMYKNPLHFDAQFFGYTPRDAELLDPQQRIFLECCWEALEVAGYDPARFPGRIGVFAGTGITHYLFDIIMRPEYRSVPAFNLITANDKDYVATRVGYKLNLKGPCITVQTACSTSLVASVLGCQSLLTYQSDMVLAGGATVHPIEVGGYEYTEGGIVSPDGHCRSFDAAAKGTIFSSGAGVLVLKRLEDAMADNDKIYAVIRGFGLNNDGGQRVGFTAPGVDGQSAVTTEALTMAGVHPEAISYVECHGTATNLGDPIEVRSLSQAFGAFTKKKGYCAIGSVKSNIGHTDSAAGVAGVIKTVLALNHRQIPPSLHFQKPNPEIHFEDTPFYVNTSLQEWKSDGPLQAGVNSFGVGGTNAHVVLEESPLLPPDSPSRPCQLLVWSARTPTALDTMTANLSAFLKEEASVNLADMAFTHQVGRRSFEHRRFLVCKDQESAAEALSQPNNPGVLTFRTRDAAPKIAFLFPGQGAQHVQMARELYANETTFRKIFDECADLFRGHINQDLRALVYPEAESSETAGERLQQTQFTQPALFATEYALAKLWEEWGIRPAVSVGHSIGEYVAACLAGVMSLADAAALVSARASLMQSLPSGSMISVLLPENEVKALLKKCPGVFLAAVNSPSACVVSGPTDRMEAFTRLLAEKNVPHRLLKTSHAFHSAMMDPILPAFRAQVERIKLDAPQYPYISNLTGTWIRAEEATDPNYWVQHLRQAVNFSSGVAELLRTHKRLLFLEVGPGRALSTLVTQQAGREADVRVISSLSPATTEGSGDLASMLKALGQIWAAGIEPDWNGFYAREQRRRIATVTYPFEREKYGSFGHTQPDVAPSQKVSKPQRRTFDEWFLTANWSRTSAIGKIARQEGTCLLFADSSPLTQSLAGGLSQRGLEVITVAEGPAFSETADGGFTVRPGAEADYDALLTSLAEREKVPTHLVHAWCLASHSVDQDLERSFYGPIFLVKSLGRNLSGKPLTISFVCGNSFDVVGDEELSPVVSAVFGPATSAAKEYKNLSVRVVDLEAAGSRADLNMLLDEVCQPRVEDQVVAVRRGHRWIRGYTPISLTDAAPAEALREGGVYLITGGLRGIGLASARYIAGQVKARFVLIGRSSLPARETWTDYLRSARVDDPVAEKIQGVLGLEELGAELLLCEADVANEGEMKQAIQRATSRFGKIHGVIHAAGTAGDGIIELKQRAAADAVLRPKIHGTLILHKLLEDEDLDFFLLYSSLTGVVGAPGQSDYTAANAFLTAFAWSQRNAPKNRPISIDWDRWDEVGMAARQMREIVAKNARLVDGAEEPLEDPIFSRRIVGRDHETYTLRVSAATHWIAGEHKIMGAPTMVGTSHLEHIRAAYALSGGSGLAEIRDLVFIQPVMLNEDEKREVYYSLRPVRDGKRDFAIWSVVNGVMAEHARGRISNAGSRTPKSYDPDHIFARCGNIRKPMMAEGVSTNGDAAAIQLSQRWAIFQRIADSEKEAIAEIRLSATHENDLSTYLMHPAVLDCATSYASGPAIRYMYLPLAYQTLRVLKTMPQVLYSYKKFKAADSGNQEVLSCDVTLFDEAGEPVIEIEGFTVKRVADPNALGPQAKPVEAAMNGGKSTDSVAARFGRRISPEEGLRALHRIIAGPWMPQVVVNVGEADLSEKPDEAGNEGAGESPNGSGSGQTYARPSLGTPYVAPRSEVEGAIAEIWQAILGIEKVGVQDDFIELGGHSLLAIQLTSRISETFGLEFSISEFYQQATVEGLAKAILVRLTEGLQDDALEELLAADADTMEMEVAAGER